MFVLLFKTRLRFYINFLRAHFDRITLIELALIGLIFLYLAARSPADIGYRLEAFVSPEFAAQWPSRWLSMLPLFYLTAEFLAWVTLRPAGEWQILAALPFPRHALLRYHLARHFLKTAGLLIIGTLPFAFGQGSLGTRGLQSAAALVFMSALQLIAFAQAHLLRSRAKKWRRWGPREILIVTLLTYCSQSEVVSHAAWPFDGYHLLAAVVLIFGATIYVHLTCPPVRLFLASAEGQRLAFVEPGTKYKSPGAGKGFLLTQLIRDALTLKRRRPAILFLCLATLLLLATVSAAQTVAVNAYSSTIFVHLIYCWIMINALMYLFEQDAAVASLMRMLPASARQWWQARWLFALGVLAIPVVLPFVIMACKFGFNLKLLAFAAATGLAVPAIFSLLFCNAAFGMFPLTNYAAIMMNLFIFLMILFWFYMPFGSLILLGFMLAWVKKSQRHFQFLEV